MALDANLIHPSNSDKDILIAWNDLVSKGVDCSLFLKHRKGGVSTTLKCYKHNLIKDPSHASNSISPATRKKSRSSKEKERRFKSLIHFQQQLSRNHGLPPSRLMIQNQEGVTVAAGDCANKKSRKGCDTGHPPTGGRGLDNVKRVSVACSQEQSDKRVQYKDVIPQLVETTSWLKKLRKIWLSPLIT